MAELTRVYHYLTTYAENQAVLAASEHEHGEREMRNGAAPGEPLCVFTREAVERTLLIAVRRQAI